MITPEYSIDIFGIQRWYLNNDLRRLDGPAYIGADGYQIWFVNDRSYYTNKAFQEAAKITDEEMTFVILKYGNVE